MSALRVVLVAEGRTESSIIPILFKRCSGIENVKFIYNPSYDGASNKVKELVKKTIFSYSYREEADLIIVGVDNDSNVYEAHCSNHDEEKFDGKCHFCEIKKEVRFAQKKIGRKCCETIIFVPVQCIESWLIFEASIIDRKCEKSPEVLNRHDCKQKFCGTNKLTQKIINKCHVPVAKEIDLEALKNVPSFKLFYTQIENFVKHWNN